MRLISKNRSLFQAEGEEALQDRLIPTSLQPCTFEELIAQKAKQDESTITQNGSTLDPLSCLTLQKPEVMQRPLLKYLPTLLLLSSYLASHTPAKHDIILFSRLSTSSTTSRRKRKYLARSRAGGISKSPKKAAKTADAPNNDDYDNDNDNENDPATPSKKPKKTPQKDLGTTAAGDATPKKERADRSMRAIFEKTSNIARPFALERVVAILRAIHPDGVARGRNGGGSGGIADRVYSELAELERLRLVVRVDAPGKGGSEDILEERWKCVVGREWVVRAGAYWGVGLEGWEFE